MRISDWSSDVCSSDLPLPRAHRLRAAARPQPEGLKTAMSALTPYASTALGAGVACLSLGATRRIDTGWKAFGLALCALAFSAAPAHADPYVEAADNAKLDCTLSSGALTRIALIHIGRAEC